MNSRRSTLIGTAVAIALFGPNDRASAQEKLEEIIVSGIRYANELSLETKRAATNVVEVVSAEDIGKMPDKNVADSLSRVPGVTVSSASANEGGFDENDRISMRGTNPSLTQTLLNGHAVAAGDWFVLNQVGQVGRSVSYTLLPSELVQQIVVHKSSEASLVEGGVAGSVDIITRKPLDFDEQLTFGLSAGAVYAELPDETDPQLSGLFNWKNDDGTFGVLVQAFSEERHLRRDGVELLGYDPIAPGSAIATSNPDLSGVVYPRLIGAAFFEQERKRTGGLVDVEFRPNDDLMIDAQYFMSDLDATNYNRNFLLRPRDILSQGAGTAPDPGYVVRNGTLVQASWAAATAPSTGIYDQISRPDEKASSNYGSLAASYRFSEEFTLSGQIGTSEGHGETPAQDVSETVTPANTGGGYQLHGIGNGPDFNFGSADTSSPVPGGNPVGFGWIFGDQFVDVEDQEDWAQIDADYAIDNGAWTNLKFGARYNKHERDSLFAVGQGPLAPPQDPANYPTTFQNYPTDFNTFGGSFPTDIWFWSPSQLAAYNGPGFVNRDPVTRLDWNSMYEVEENNSAAYAQMDFKGSNWSGNIGLRYARTEEDIVSFVSVPADADGNPLDPDGIGGSAFGAFKRSPVDHTYDDWLPSANLKWDVTEDLVARFAAAMTMTRPDYSALAGFVNLGAPPATIDEIGGGSGGNPDLEPIRSTNYDIGLEWYFAKNSLLAATLFIWISTTTSGSVPSEKRTLRSARTSRTAQTCNTI
jgi:iron complex outermembrane receptor protein